MEFKMMILITGVIMVVLGVEPAMCDFAQQCDGGFKKCTAKVNKPNYMNINDIPTVDIDSVYIANDGCCELDLAILVDYVKEAEELHNASVCQVGITFVCVKGLTHVFFKNSDVYSRGNHQLFWAFNIVSCIASFPETADPLFYPGRLSFLEFTGSYIGPEVNCTIFNSLERLITYVDQDLMKLDRNTQLLWRRCSNVFHELVVLGVAVKENVSVELSQSELQTLFPNLQELLLEDVTITSTLVFPWAKQYVSKTKSCVPYNHSMASSRDNSLIRSLSINNCKTQDIFLNGTVNYLAYKGGNISQLHFNADVDFYTFGATKDSMKRVDISRDNIYTVNKDWFQNQKFIEKLNLAHNNISHVSPDLFKDFHNLGIIELQFNNISFLESTVFQHVVKTMTELYLHHNPLRNIPVQAFYSPSLRLLALHDTLLNTYSLETFLEAAEDLRIELTLISKAKKGYRLAINMTNCLISTLPTIPFPRSKTLKIILRSTTIDLQNNPIRCNCKIEPFQRVLEYTDKRVKDSWVCTTPSEFNGRTVSDIGRSELYCPTRHPGCPENCNCYRKTYSGNLIIDCRSVKVDHLPQNFKTTGYKSIEMWYSNCSIDKLNAEPYLHRVDVFDVSHNKLTSFTPVILKHLTNANTIRLHSNKLKYLPESITNARFSEITIRNNSFLCDCHSKWMKNWLLDKDAPVKDRAEVTCIDIYGDTRRFVEVPDEKFICQDVTSRSRHVSITIIIASLCLLLIGVVCFVTYINRFNIKVLLHLYFNIRMCDKELPKDVQYDFIVIYDPVNKETVYETILKPLEQKEYKCADIYRDCFIGLSTDASVDTLIEKCGRVLFVLDDDTKSKPQILKLAWKTAYKIAKKTTMNFVTVISIGDKLTCSSFVDETLQRFLKRGRVLKLTSSLFLPSLEYVINTRGTRSLKTLHAMLPSSNRILYYQSRETGIKVRQRILKGLGAVCSEFLDLDQAFLPGADIRDEVYEVFNCFSHLVFVLTRDTVYDEEGVFLLKCAMTKSILDGENFLLLCYDSDMDLDQLNVEIRGYLEHYVTANIQDETLVDKLVKSTSYNSYVVPLQYDNVV